MYPSFLLYHKHTAHTTIKSLKFDKKIPLLSGLRKIILYETVKDPSRSKCEPLLSSYMIITILLLPNTVSYSLQ